MGVKTHGSESLTTKQVKEMTYNELKKVVAEQSGVTQVETDKVLKTLTNVIAEEIGGGIALPNLGKFTVKELAERKGTNPSTGQEITIPARKAVKFTPALYLKEAVQNA